MRVSHRNSLLLLLLLSVSVLLHLCSPCGAQQDVGSFFQLTDLHIDFDYLPGSSPNCNLPLCCHYINDTDPVKAGPIGDYLCDATVPMLTTALEFMASMKPDFVMWTGDNPCHRMWKQDREIVLNVTNRVTKYFQEYFPTTPVYPLIGNHDTFPVDEMPPPPDSQWLLDALTEMWRDWLTPDAIQTFEKGGYYTMQLMPGFRLVVLNTQWADPLNFILYVNDTDPTGQLAWLSTTLSAAQSAGEKVLVAGHISMGPLEGEIAPRCIPWYCNKYNAIVENYGDIIMGHIFGHTHTDYWRLLYKGDVPTLMYWVAPSVTPYQNLNPTIRRFVFNKTTFDLLDIHQYYTNLQVDNEQKSVTWELEYSFVEEYGIPDMSAASIAGLVQRMHTDRSLFDKFYKHYFNNFSPTPACDKYCYARWLCVLGTAEFNRSLECFSHVGASNPYPQPESLLRMNTA